MKIYSDLDIVRAVISSSCVNDVTVNPIHFLRLESLAKIFGLNGDLLELLNTLKNIHEIEHLGNGYWAPCPSRNIRVGNYWMIISAMPTEQIASIVTLLATDSAARVSENYVEEFPFQELNDWIGVTDLRSWLFDEFELIKQNISLTTLNPLALKYYTPKSKTSLSLKYKNWYTYADLTTDEKKRILLVRHDHKYYWCLFDGETLLESTIQIADYNYLIRAQLAIEMLNEKSPRVIKVVKEKETIAINQIFPFPKEEESLLSALGNKKTIDGVVSYRLPFIFYELASEIFLNTHIKFE